MIRRPLLGGVFFCLDYLHKNTYSISMKKINAFLWLVICLALLAGKGFAFAPGFDRARHAFETRLSTDTVLKKALLKQVRPITVNFNYATLLDKDTDVLLLGEEHGNESAKRETNLMLKYFGQHKEGFTHFGSEFYLSSEQPFLDQYAAHKITLPELEGKLTLGKRYSASAAVATRYGMAVLGLDIPKAQDDYTWSQSPAGMRARNEHWTKIISAIAKADPMSRFIIYGGAWHTQLSASEYPTMPQLLNKEGLKTKTVEYVSAPAWAALAAEANLSGKTLLFKVPANYRKDANADFFIFLPKTTSTDAEQKQINQIMDDKNFQMEHCTDDPDHPLCKVFINQSHR